MNSYGPTLKMQSLYVAEIMERPIGIEPTPEPWQVCKEWSVNNLRGIFRSTK